MKGITFISGLITGLLASGIALPVFAQVTSDRTTNTTVNQNGNNFNILNGIQKGNNLFHSFDKFSIPKGNSAVFNNSSDVVNIINRVTGGSISNIDGLIKANGNANLFLINPNGIVFGENAKLDIGGSFFGSTASSILFKDEFEFSAVNPQEKPLLTISVPVGLQMGVNPGNIRVNGSGHNLIAQDATASPYINLGSANFLQVKPGKTLALVGGDIQLNGGILKAAEGRIELASVKEGRVNLVDTSKGFLLDNSKISNFGDIQLQARTLIDVSGKDAGEVHLVSDRLNIIDGSVVMVQNRGIQTAGDINLQAKSIILSGGIADSQIRSSLINETIAGDSGNININTDRLSILDGAAVFTRTFNLGNSGSIDINATESIDVIGVSAINPSQYSVIASNTFSEGNTGNIKLSTKNLSVLNSGIISATTFNDGSAGNITINSENTQVAGKSQGIFGVTAIAGATFGEGDAGSLTFNTQTLSVRDSASVATTSYNSGDSGSIIVNATKSIETAGGNETQAANINSSVLSDSSPLAQLLGLPLVPSGNAGNITLNTPFLKLNDYGGIGVRNAGKGNAGSLKVNADSIILDNRSGLSAIANNGNGGNIVLDAKTLDISNQAQINVSTLNSKSGNIQLQIDERLQLSNQAKILADAFQAGRSGNINITASETILSQGSRITNDVQGTATGGSLILNGDRLSVSGGSRLSAITSGEGNAGNLLVKVGNIEVSGVENSEVAGVGFIPTPSFIAAGAFQGSSGKGGSLTVDSNRIRITDGGLLAAGTFGSGASGDVKINATQSLIVSGIGDLPAPFFGYFTNHPSHISATSFSDAPAGSIAIQAHKFVVEDGGIVEVNAAGMGGAGNLKVIGNRILLDNGSLQAEVAGGNQGNITLDSNLLLLRNRSTITTNATGSASGGNININSVVIAGFENSDIIANALEGMGGNINIATSGIFGLKFRDKLTPESDITASSKFGINGRVDIKNFGIDPSSGLVELPVELLESSQQVATGCLNKAGNTFVVTGRGGMPHSPSQSLNSNPTWYDLRDLSASHKRNNNIETIEISNKTAIVEATGFIRNENGEIELVAAQNTPLTTRFPNCDDNT